MGEFLAKIGQSLLAGGKKGLRAVATGNTQASLGMQSPHLAGAATRVGRFFYAATLGWIGVTWYTGFVNERTQTGEGPKFVLPGGREKVINSPDRPDRSVTDVVGDALGGGKSSASVPTGPVTGVPFSPIAYHPNGANRTLVALSPAQLGVPGSAIAGYLWSAPSGEKQMPTYDPQRYQQLLSVAQKIATNFHLTITSGYRPGSQGAGGPDLHSVGLAFDMVGRITDMKRAASWASGNPGLFQEIFVHNEGSGLHLHLGLYPDTAQIIKAGGSRYNRASTGPATAQSASRHPAQFV